LALAALAARSSSCLDGPLRLLRSLALLALGRRMNHSF
jgi:hypothetical protein